MGTNGRVLFPDRPSSQSAIEKFDNFRLKVQNKAHAPEITERIVNQ